MGRGKRRRKSRKPLPPGEEAPGAWLYGGGTLKDQLPKAVIKAMILPTHLRYMLTSNMTNRFSIYDSITSGFMGYFCSRNFSGFHRVAHFLLTKLASGFL